jgi:succinate-acetate transporter protein
MTSTVASPANPAALGLAAFGLTTVLLSTINAGFLPAGGEAVVIPLALAFGGTAQMVAGLMEYRLQNVFGATAFLSYGAFWWWFGLLVLLGHNNVLDLTQAGSTIGFGLILWGIFTFGLWIASFRLARAVWLIFATLWVTFFLLGAGAMLGMPGLSRLGGLTGMLCGALALYGSFAIVANATFGRVIAPLGERV